MIVAAALLVALRAAAGCRDEPGRPYACSCAFLTDFDDASSLPARVCAPSAERAPAIARGCAQTTAPAPVQECTCRPAEGAPCAGRACLPR